MGIEQLTKDDKPYAFQPWPSWRYGPDGAAEIFNSEAEVPKGWVDHPSKVGKAAARAEAPETPTPAPAPAPEAAVAPAATEGKEVDAAGTVWSPELHAATKTKTGAGLWRMKVGVRRPEGQEKSLDL